MVHQKDRGRTQQQTEQETEQQTEQPSQQPEDEQRRIARLLLEELEDSEWEPVSPKMGALPHYACAR